MTRSIPWLRVFIEGVVIVGSILLAFGIDAWWEGRQERAEELEYLRGLEVDFTANRQQLRSVMEDHLRWERVLADLDSMSEAELASVPFDAVAPYLMALHNARTFDARDGTLDGVITSGKLDSIRDPQLRDLLVGWKAAVDDLDEEAAELRVAADRVLQRTTEMGGPWRGDVGGRDRGSVDLSDFPPLVQANFRRPRADLTVIGSDAELLGLAQAKRFRATGYLRQMEPLLAHVDSVLALIQPNR